MCRGAITRLSTNTARQPARTACEAALVGYPIKRVPEAPIRGVEDEHRRTGYRGLGRPTASGTMGVSHQAAVKGETSDGC